MAKLLNLTLRKVYYCLGKANDGRVFELQPGGPKKALNSDLVNLATLMATLQK